LPDQQKKIFFPLGVWQLNLRILKKLRDIARDRQTEMP
jgi:hypothetical protein